MKLTDGLKEQGFYNTTTWQRLRQMAKQRDNYLCQSCLRNNRITRAVEVHHIKPVDKYPELALSLGNLESLCRSCHDGTRASNCLHGPTAKARVIKISGGNEQLQIGEASRPGYTPAAESSRA